MMTFYKNLAINQRGPLYHFIWVHVGNENNVSGPPFDVADSNIL